MILESILKINPNAKVTVYGRDIDTCTFDWHGTTEISKEDIKDKLAELQAEYDANQYQRDRNKAYPSIKDQLDDIYHNGIDGWKATIKVTKDKYPKS
jgi:hypothetical protein